MPKAESVVALLLARIRWYHLHIESAHSLNREPIDTQGKMAKGKPPLPVCGNTPHQSASRIKRHLGPSPHRLCILGGDPFGVAPHRLPILRSHTFDRVVHIDDERRRWLTARLRKAWRNE